MEGAEKKKNPGGFSSFATCTDLHCASVRLEKPDERNYCDPEHSSGALKKVERRNLGFICKVSLPVRPCHALKGLSRNAFHECPRQRWHVQIRQDSHKSPTCFAMIKKERESVCLCASVCVCVRVSVCSAHLRPFVSFKNSC